MKMKKMASAVSADMVTTKNYDRWVAKERTDGVEGKEDRLTYDIVCVANEAGELLKELKAVLNGKSLVSNAMVREFILLECGDIIHYLARTLNDIGSDLSEAIDANVEKLENRKKYGRGKKGTRS